MILNEFFISHISHSNLSYFPNQLSFTHSFNSPIKSFKSLYAKFARLLIFNYQSKTPLWFYRILLLNDFSVFEDKLFSL